MLANDSLSSTASIRERKLFWTYAFPSSPTPQYNARNTLSPFEELENARSSNYSRPDTHISGGSWQVFDHARLRQRTCAPPASLNIAL